MRPSSHSSVQQSWAAVRGFPYDLFLPVLSAADVQLVRFCLTVLRRRPRSLAWRPRWLPTRALRGGLASRPGRWPCFCRRRAVRIQGFPSSPPFRACEWLLSIRRLLVLEKDGLRLARGQGPCRQVPGPRRAASLRRRVGWRVSDRCLPAAMVGEFQKLAQKGT